MKRQFKNFIGIDISKLTLDFALCIDGTIIFYQQISNSKAEVKKLLGKLKRLQKIDLSETIFCMEHTGCYGNRLVEYLLENNLKIWIEPGVQIRNSSGMQRGKSDQLDCKKIAVYAYTHSHKIQLYQAPRHCIQQLKILSSERSRLIKCKKQVSVSVQEQALFTNKILMKKTQARTNKIIKQLEEQIKEIDKQVNLIYQDDEKLKRTYEIISSIPGIGLLTSLEIIVTTQEFTKISEAKKYACYSGLAPFDHSSGTSIRGKSRVSHMANKKVKTALHMAALSAIGVKGEIRDYYQRKVQEGKNKMSVINAVRNKLILRVFACVKQNKIFQTNYNYDLVLP